MLFSGDTGADALNLCEYIDEFYSRMGENRADISVEKIFAVVNGMTADCPYHFGIEAASPFKKAASFTCNMTAEKPLHTPIKAFGDPLAAHQNAIVAFVVSMDMLDGAELQCANRGRIVLSNRIRVSEHFLKDAVNALSSATPVNHFYTVALLYEALAYWANPEASYERVF